MVRRILLLGLLVGCSDGTLMTEGGGDGGAPDRGAQADAAVDEGGEVDRGVPDMNGGSGEDAGVADSGVSDVLGCADESEIDADDRELFRIINDYRETRGLPRVPFSCSLSSVARQHVADLIDNAPNSGSCNLHSWSDAGSWSGCCYTPDHAQASCMWDKPRELTDYPGNGYEISTGGARSPQHSLDLWIGSSGHHNVIINEDIWTRPWGAMGVAITPGSFAHVWFGHEADPG